MTLTLEDCLAHGLSESQAKHFIENSKTLFKKKLLTWDEVSILLSPDIPFSFHVFLFSLVYPHWESEPDNAPYWFPPKENQKTNLEKCMHEVKQNTYQQFHQWSLTHYEKFWQLMLDHLKISFIKTPEKIVSLEQGVETPSWFVNAKMNIAQSCFTAPKDKTAIIYFDEKEQSLKNFSYGELDRFSNRIANSLLTHHFKPGDALAIAMPMNIEAVAIYLGIIKMGGVVISIADSFSSDEMATRLDIGKAKAIFIQDVIFRNQKPLPSYEKIQADSFPPGIVISKNNFVLTRKKDLLFWENFLVENESFEIIPGDPMSPINILFSSGTTGAPKAIPWNHTTPIKTASDAYLHHNIQQDDIIAWPTNLGWMMGPWLLFAGLINQATIAVYTDVPTDKTFGKFIQDAKVTILGVIPTIVAHWRQTQCMQGLNWNSIKLFTSTGEASHPEDMLYLSSLARYKPILEYCGGTEIGGAYVSSTLLEKNYLSLATTATFGLDFVLLDETQTIASEEGEVAIIPPSIGLSTTLLNANHHQIYYEGMPFLAGKPLRRHGDQLRRYSNGAYSILGRVDDTMNLSGIKISSVEIERVLTGIENVIETAAIAISHQGPSQLTIVAAVQKNLDKQKIQKEMQQRINQHLNPLFKIHDLIFVNELPKTASNKIMRRILRKNISMKTI